MTFEVGRGVECMMPRRLAQPCPLSLCSRPAHAVVYPYVLRASATTWMAWLSCMMPRCLAQPCPLPPILTASKRCRVLGSSYWIQRYRFLFLLSVSTLRFPGSWYGSIYRCNAVVVGLRGPTPRTLHVAAAVLLACCWRYQHVAAAAFLH